MQVAAASPGLPRLPPDRQLCSPEELMDQFDLSPAEARFSSLYVANPTNASACAREAGFSARSAHSQATDLLRRPEVAAAIAQEMNKLQERTRVTQDRILHELAILAFSNINDFYVTNEGNLGLRPGVPEYMLRAVQSVKRKVTRKTDADGNEYEWVDMEIKLWNKTEALKLAGQHYGMYTENVNVRGKVEHEHKQVWDFGGRQIIFS